MYEKEVEELLLWFLLFDWWERAIKEVDSFGKSLITWNLFDNGYSVS
jgi:hypothetical protein